MEGYVPSLLPWSTNKRPKQGGGGMFLFCWPYVEKGKGAGGDQGKWEQVLWRRNAGSFLLCHVAVAPHSQGNIWLFEDSVLITGKVPDSSSQPMVKFPKNILTIPDKTNMSSVMAYLTVPHPHLAKDCTNCTPGFISNKSVFRSIDLKAVAAISVLLYSSGEELQVRGPIQISLPLGHHTHLRASDTVPAWAFNQKTGGWENHGLGIVKTVGNELVWTYTASHLGYWIAAPLPSSRDYLGHANSLDFLSYHTYLLTRPAAPLYENITPDRLKGPQPSPHYINSEEVSRLREKSEQNRANINCDNFFQDKLVHIYNQPVAIIPAPELFSAQEQQLPGCKSATFPRNGSEYDAHSEPASKDSYTQTLPKVPHHHSQGGSSPQQSSQDDPQPLETPPQGQGPNSVWGRYSNLLESSVSVPGTLNEAAGMEGFNTGHGVPSELQGISERTLLELTRGKSLSSPRAWFVSLDGKPAAQVRHSIIELQSHHRPPSSNDTSLDSGVDMNEPQQSIRETERDRPSIRASSLPHHSRGGRYGEEQDLSSSESGTTATCTPEDPSLRNILDGSSGAIPNIPEERDGMDTSSAQEDSESRGTPPPRRLRKVREKGKTEKRSAKHIREGRPLTKRS
ncbi:LOW QUALITY PROTEIN: protein FAM171B-like [Oreochromis niloticus]|uniref:LOW QUALITY PROTEIN: protein FAM171B-like n=1 Tax=Oreochromis niloticus TaxID=8128 RepID=UPI0009055FCA|nr:LOW QUALITY PROTEIN: protein FAM171B-like [Oreochromis niloticus]